MENNKFYESTNVGCLARSAFSDDVVVVVVVVVDVDVFIVVGTKTEFLLNVSGCTTRACIECKNARKDVRSTIE